MIRTGFETWLSADCGSAQHPNIQVFDAGFVACAKKEYNTDAANANIYMFRDQDWPYENEKLAVTTVQFNPETGEIRGADVEIDAENFDLTLTDPGGFDLQSVVTHESGHFLGLSHSCTQSAMMMSQYSGKRSLAADDVSAVCATYPPVAKKPACDPTPPHGFSADCREPDEETCGCRAPGSDADAGLGWMALIGLLGGLRRAATARSRNARPTRRSDYS